MKWFIIPALFIFLTIPACTSGPKPSLNSANADLRRETIQRLSNSSKAAKHFADFVAMLESDSDYLVRAQAAVALGKLKDLKAIPVLIKALSDSHAQVRIDVANALGKINDPQAIPALQNLLSDDRSPGVRRAGAKALGKIGSEESLDTLIQALDEVDPGVAELSYQALKQITKQNLPNDIKAWEKWHKEQK